MTEQVAQTLVNGDCPGHHNCVAHESGCLNPHDSLSKRIFSDGGAFHSVCAGSGGGQLTDGVCIALDGDQMKPRENPASGGNGLGVNEDGVGYTLTGVDRHGVAYCADGGEVAATITRQIAEQSGQDNRANAVVECFENYATDARVVPTSSAPTQGATRNGNASNNKPLVVHKQTPFVKTSHASGKNGLGEKWEQCEVAGTRNAIEGGDGRNQECIVYSAVAQNTRDEVRVVGGDEPEVSPTLSHQPSALEPTVAIATILSQMRYIVRRLTPVECERLQGIPDGYTIPVGLRRYATISPDGQTMFDPSLVSEFQRVFDAYNAIMYDYAMADYERSHREGEPPPKPPKPKSAKQVAAWLAKISDPATCPDSPRYKGLGNGWAVNQPRWILTRLLAIGEGIDPFTGEELYEV